MNIKLMDSGPFVKEIFIEIPDDVKGIPIPDNWPIKIENPLTVPAQPSKKEVKVE